MELIEDRQIIKPSKGRYFFVAMACVFILLTIIGFGSDYVMIVNSTQITGVHWFAKVHGAIMGSWLLIFLTQTILAARRNLKFHRQLGLFSIGLAILVWLSMIIASVRAEIAASPPVDAQDGSWDILLINLFGIILFGLFFTWGILVRKKAANHKLLLYFATTVLIQAGIDRIRFLPGMSSGVNFIYLDVFLIVPLLIYDYVTTKRIHKITKIGATIIVVVQIAMTIAWGTSAWHKFCFNCFAPFVEKVVEVKMSDVQIEPLLGDYGDKKDTAWYMTVLREGDKVYLKLSNEPKFEMAATAQNEWFLRTMAWKVSFIKGEDGKVIKLINRQPGLLWEASKLR